MPRAVKGVTFMSGTNSGPKGVSTLVSVACTRQVPKNESGKVRSDGPPPRDVQALSTACGKALAYRQSCFCSLSQMTAFGIISCIKDASHP